MGDITKNPFEALGVKNTIDFDEIRRDVQDQAKFLPYLKLVQDLSPEAKDKENPVKPGNFMLGELILGESVRILVCAKRDHAIHLKGNSKVTESYHKSSPIYKRLKATLPPKGEQIMVGPDWLLFLPDFKGFCTFLTGKTSNRTIGWHFADHMQKPKDRTEATKDLPYTNCFMLESKWIDKGMTFKFWGPAVIPAKPEEDWFPDKDSLVAAHSIFMSPVQNEATIEEATDDR